MTQPPKSYHGQLSNMSHPGLLWVAPRVEASRSVDRKTSNNDEYNHHPVK